MADPDQNEADATRERERADAHQDTADMLERQAEEQRKDQAREEDAHE